MSAEREFPSSPKPVQNKVFGRIVKFPHNRLIPIHGKLQYGDVTTANVSSAAQRNLYISYHDNLISKGGISLTAANVRLLCAA